MVKIAQNLVWYARKLSKFISTKSANGSAVMYRRYTYEPPHDKTNKMTVCPAKTQISLGIHPVWSESSLSVWRKLGSLATHWAHSEDSVQTGRMPRLIWVFAGRTVILLVLSWGGSYVHAAVVTITAFYWWYSVEFPAFNLHYVGCLFCYDPLILYLRTTDSFFWVIILTPTLIYSKIKITSWAR